MDNGFFGVMLMLPFSALFFISLVVALLVVVLGAAARRRRHRILHPEENHGWNTGKPQKR